MCCGESNSYFGGSICPFCLEERFEDANPENKLCSGESLLPGEVKCQHALWKFDKGGALQDLLHQFKYNGVINIGIDIGRQLGRRVEKHAGIKALFEQKPNIILPVPLHKKRYRRRGFNQAAVLAEGFAQRWSFPLCAHNDVLRIKNTHTQTGFSLEKRLQNMEHAFSVEKPQKIGDKQVIIIDDVFTTGSTTFELGQTLLKAGAKSIVILTAAQA